MRLEHRRAARSLLLRRARKAGITHTIVFPRSIPTTSSPIASWTSLSLHGVIDSLASLMVYCGRDAGRIGEML
jgi:hypothetical protein